MMHFREQAAEALRHADDLSFLAARGSASCEPLQEPCAEGVERRDPGNIDDHRSRLRRGGWMAATSRSAAAACAAVHGPVAVNANRSPLTKLERRGSALTFMLPLSRNPIALRYRRYREQNSLDLRQ